MRPEDHADYHKYLTVHDLYELMGDLIKRGNYIVREVDGKLVPNTTMGGIDAPWHYVMPMRQFQCDRWHKLLFDVIGSKLAAKGIPRFVPSKCQQCWKVVVRPKTLKQLFQLLDIQKRMEVPAKCGIEKRDSVHGLYGGYFYTNSFQDGLQRYSEVRKAINDVMGEDVPVIYKRACTEYELAVPDSKHWKVYDWQMGIEELIERWVVVDDVDRRQPEWAIDRVHKNWINWAYANGDATYKFFTGGRELYKPYVTYHHLADCTAEEIREFWDETNGISKDTDLSETIELVKGGT